MTPGCQTLESMKEVESAGYGSNDAMVGEGKRARLQQGDFMSDIMGQVDVKYFKSVKC